MVLESDYLCHTWGERLFMQKNEYICHILFQIESANNLHLLVNTHFLPYQICRHFLYLQQLSCCSVIFLVNTKVPVGAMLSSSARNSGIFIDQTP